MLSWLTGRDALVALIYSDILSVTVEEAMDSESWDSRAELEKVLAAPQFALEDDMGLNGVIFFCLNFGIFFVLDINF